MLSKKQQKYLLLFIALVLIAYGVAMTLSVNKKIINQDLLYPFDIGSINTIKTP